MRELDRRLAFAMSFRQVLADTARQLSMGTVVRRAGNAAAQRFYASRRNAIVVRLVRKGVVPLPPPFGSEV